jgi:Mg-chelatase subunit ChlI
VILKTARAHAAFQGRQAINDRDIALAAELALPHRLRRGPFQQSETSLEELQDRIERIQTESVQTEMLEPAPSDESDVPVKKKKAEA